MAEVKGLIRKIDELGRIVIPIELRRLLNVNPNDPLEIRVEGDAFVIRKNLPHCLFCTSNNNLIPFKGYLICRNCSRELVQSSPFCLFCGSTSDLKSFRGSWICIYCRNELTRSVNGE